MSDDGYFVQAVSPVDAVAQFWATSEDDEPRCACVATALSGSAGRTVVMRVGGQLDVATLPALAEALENAFERRPAHLVIDLAALVFCSARGLATFVDAGRRAATDGVGYSVSGASAQALSLWSSLWPRHQVPPQFTTAAGAVGAARARRAAGHRLGSADGPGAPAEPGAIGGCREDCRPPGTTIRPPIR